MGGREVGMMGRRASHDETLEKGISRSSSEGLSAGEEEEASSARRSHAIWKEI